MANGDLAAANGWATVPGSKDIRQGFDDINRLADWVAARTAGVSAVAGGLLSVNATGSNGAYEATTTVTLPTGRFASAPSVAANPNTGAQNEQHIGIQALTSTSFTLYYFRTNAASGVSIYWVAVSRG